MSSWGEPEQEANCWFNNLSWHTAEFVSVYCHTSVIKLGGAEVDMSSPEIAKYHMCRQIAAISPASAATVATHVG